MEKYEKPRMEVDMIKEEIILASGEPAGCCDGRCDTVG